MKNAAIKNLRSIDELRQLISVFALAFETEYTVADEYLEHMISNSAAVILGAMVNDSVVGGLVAFELCPIHGAKELYIYDIAVHPEYQQQNIGKKLIDYLKGAAKERSVKTIFVEAEADDAGAVAFYRAIGGEELPVNHFNFKVQ